MQSRKNFSILFGLHFLLTIILILFLWLSVLQKDYRYTLYIGLNDQNSNIQEIETEKEKEIVDDICLKYVDGLPV